MIECLSYEVTRCVVCRIFNIDIDIYNEPIHKLYSHTCSHTLTVTI